MDVTKTPTGNLAGAMPAAGERRSDGRSGRVGGRTDSRTGHTDPGVAPALLEHHRQLAMAALNTHVNLYGQCRRCGYTFPCEAAQLAERNLDLVSAVVGAIL